MNLQTSIESVKGVGPKTAEQLRKSGLRTVGDLINFLPRKHEDFSKVSDIRDINPGKVTIRARCESVEIKRVRRGMTVTTATLVDDRSDKLRAVWFNQPYRAKQLQHSDDEFYFSGEFEYNYNRYQLTNPSVESVTGKSVSTDRIVPIYRQVSGLKSQVVRKLLLSIRPIMAMLPETLPEDIVAKESLMSRSDAILGMHFPENMEDIDCARERLGFEELFELLVASQLNKQQNSRLDGWDIAFDVDATKDFVAKLPFQLTDAQRRAAWDIFQDFEKASPMNRLLQGDVGSGKTVVAALAARAAAGAGYQTAIMAPTEILATQHAETMNSLLSPFGISVGLLTGSVKASARKPLLEQIKSGEVDVVIGTHALFQPNVEFHKLGLAIIDEQHRFGVAQRQDLLKKSEKLPHLLAMTATPIPRSLQLTVFGELDVSVLDEMPPGRQPIMTKICSPNSREQVYESIDAELARGRQCYVVCRLIDDNTDNEQKSVEAEYRKIKSSRFKNKNIGLLHGKMKPAEKDEVMSDFASGKIDILVSTTVIEVGVDVPNASLMLIENADQFGLSQLHQLRGRVGRGQHQSYCFLMMSDSKAPSKRLREIEKSQDGFYLAEVDLQLRGPGEIYGRAQHGSLNLEVATLGDTKMIARVSRVAQSFVDSGADLLQYKQLAQEVEQYQRLTTLN